MFHIKNLETFTKYLQGRQFLSKLLSLERILIQAGWTNLLIHLPYLIGEFFAKELFVAQLMGIFVATEGL